MGKIVVDAMGESCPIPVVKASRALMAMTEPGTLEVRVDNETAVQNLARMALGNKLTAESRQVQEKEFVVTIEVPAPVGGAPLEEPPMVLCGAGAKGGLLVAVDTDVMGRGSDELGKVLMKGFLYAVSQLPAPPETMLFYNGGARLTCRGSESLGDLESLEARGVEILTCGTCLDHYGLKEQLAVGGVTNMYAIVEKLAGAGRVVKP
ncbi:sulfurtransferase-like selenium metabolism protein YedF [uncultured Oscillibacter sp.]|uniref:sulfurtransferase-like selenium metabolism protein YedF n=1 Tax=uncultured Oscillibacter sp. TaxID=876091 RepID=UPI002621D76A|nr:sulfurtransferase-like selenium metabolism protein YedF [uncultured Oscillibacter sp.]